jgi:hypothetical protein
MRALARRVRADVDLPGGFFRWMRGIRPRSDSHASFFAER